MLEIFCSPVFVGVLVGALDEFGYAQWFLFLISTCQYSFIFFLTLFSLPMQSESYRKAIAAHLPWGRNGPLNTTARLSVGFSYRRFLFSVSYLSASL